MMQISKEKENKSKQKMLPLPLKLVREAITHHPILLSQNTHRHNRRTHRRPSHHLHHHHSHDLEEEEEYENEDEDDVYNSKPTKTKIKIKTKTKTPLLLFLPTRELISDTYRLAKIAREMGMDLYPTPSLSHIIFSFSSPPPSPSSSSSSSAASSASSSALSLSSSFSMPLPTGSVLISFPSLSSSSLSHLRSFVTLSKGLFKLVFFTDDSDYDPKPDDARDWDCCSVSLFSRRTGDRIESMQLFSRALAGMGWTLFSTRKNTSLDSVNNTGTKSVYLFRKVDSGIVRGGRGNGERRIRELRLPSLDFRNAPLKILQYVVLMTDDVFYLG